MVDGNIVANVCSFWERKESSKDNLSLKIANKKKLLQKVKLVDTMTQQSFSELTLEKRTNTFTAISIFFKTYRV